MNESKEAIIAVLYDNGIGNGITEYERGKSIFRKIIMEEYDQGVYSASYTWYVYDMVLKTIAEYCQV